MSRLLIYTALLINFLPLMTNAQINNARIVTYLNDEANAVGPDGSLPAVEASRDFVEWVLANWKSTIAALPKLSLDPRQQALFVVAGEFLDPPDYVVFVESICSLREKGEIPPTTLRFVLWAGMTKRDFLGYNHEVPEIERLAARLEKQVTKDYPGDWLNFFSDLKSGELKKNIIARRAREGQQMPVAWAVKSAPPEVIEGASLPQSQGKLEKMVPNNSSQMTGNQVTSSTQWRIIVVLIVVAIGLLWLLLKKSK
jgi:hypothetical protein